jgi:glycosyltransferase involved in cell wall biosynthesis
VPNGVNPAIFRAKPPPESEPIYFAYAGSFRAWQSIDILIDAFERLDRGGAHLHLIGFTPNDTTSITLKAALAQRLGSRVTLDDWVPPERLPEQLGSAHVLVIPRTAAPAMRGGLPSKFAEYLAIGRPVIVTDVDDSAVYVREQQCGIVCAPTVAGMSEALRCALNWNASQRAQMGKQARTLAESTFSWEIITARYVQILEQLCGQSVRARDGLHNERQEAR